MNQKNYRISLKVPLGTRQGIMRLQVTDGKVEGNLNIMNKENEFTGVLLKDGQLSITGSIRTLISTMRYTATGTMSEHHILLNIKMECGSYYPLYGEEFNIDDEIL